MSKLYAGIGARKTPLSVQKQMTSAATQLGLASWMLRSGHAKGADQAFEAGAITKQIHLPFNGYEGASADGESFIVPTVTPELIKTARAHHPVYDRLSPQVQLFMLRNATIILGQDLMDPVKMVICWTPEGRAVGGTGNAIGLAGAFGIPVFNIYHLEEAQALCRFVDRIDQSA